MLYVLLFYCFTFASSASNSTSEDVSKCLKEFYTTAYHGEYNCTKNLNLFAENSTDLKTVFTTGKSCFLEVAEEECPRNQFNFLSKNYDIFLSDLTANSTNCTSSNQKYKAQKCQPLINDMPTKIALVPERPTKINDSKILDAINLCNQVKSCYEQNCFYTDSDKKEIGEYCEMIELSNTEFTICQGKIHKEAPDLSEYTCLKGFDFYDGTAKNVIEKYTSKKECTKEIMDDICGKVEDFDKYSDIYVKNLRRLDTMQKSFVENDQEE